MPQEESESPHQPSPGASAAPGSRAIQLDDDAILDAWIDDLESTDSTASEAGDEVDRLFADRRVVTMLRAQSFEGPLWEEFANVLAAYGYAVIRAWIRDGKIYGKCREKGVKSDLTPLDPNGPNFPLIVEELACDTVGEAIARFRDRVLIPGKWNPDKAGPRGAASLRTYFIGQALFTFADLYRDWRARHIDQPEPTDPVEIEPKRDDEASDPERHIIDQAAFEQHSKARRSGRSSSGAVGLAGIATARSRRCLTLPRRPSKKLWPGSAGGEGAEGEQESHQQAAIPHGSGALLLWEHTREKDASHHTSAHRPEDRGTITTVSASQKLE